MKKLILSFSVIIIFAFYALNYQKYSVVNDAAGTQPVFANPQSDSAISKIKNRPGNANNQASPPMSPSAMPNRMMGMANSPYRDGTYVGSTENAYYGNVQVQATISGGELTDVSFLDYPQDRQTSRYINSQAMPMLMQEAISAKSAQIDGVSGATDTSMAFKRSLASALAQAAK